MLSSRTEMQKVIETARAQSYAAFMTTPSVPLPTAVPAIIPAAVPELKKELSRERDIKSEKKDRRRSRSRSPRDRKERDRRDRRYRERSRTRSRERRERRRRERSRSHGRSRSHERDRKSRDRKRSPETQTQKSEKKIPELWNNTHKAVLETPAPTPPNPPNLLDSFGGSVDEARRTLTALGNLSAANGRSNLNNFAANFVGAAQRSRESWPPQNLTSNADDILPNNIYNNFLNKSEDSLTTDNRPRVNPAQNFPPKRFPQRNNFHHEQYPPSNERETLPDTCVKLQPFYGGYGDIRRFFQGSFISNVGIKFINDEFGHRTGIVYIQFGHPQGKIDALTKNGDSLNGVTVEVAHIEDDQFEEAVDRYQPDNFQQASDDRHKYRSKNITKYFNKSDPSDLKVFSCLTVEDLPTYVKEQDILKMFSPRPLISLFLTSKPRGGHIAYVKFGSADEARKAFEEKSNHIVESKAVTVKPFDDRDFDNISQQLTADIDRKPTPPAIVETDCISMSQLPLQTTSVEIADFFSDIGVRPLKIHLMNNRMGFTGQAFCEFKDFEDTAMALKKDNASFGPNQVCVEAYNRDEMEHILQQSYQQNLPPPLLPLRAPGMNQQRPFFPRGVYDGGLRPRFMGHRPPRPRFLNAVPSDDAPVGCTVYLDNVPYKAGTNEILDFFEGYDITNNVSRRFNPNNTPSAEAKVIFSSPEEAFRAVQEKSGQKIWERSIYLKQV